MTVPSAAAHSPAPSRHAALEIQRDGGGTQGPVQASANTPVAPSAASESLAPGDFRQLGVRPWESRPRVIRKATVRRARPLVAQYLAERSPQAEAELVRVVTLSYRLLDPRNRSSQPERVLLAQMEKVPKVPHLWTHPGVGEGDGSALADQYPAASLPAPHSAVPLPERQQRFRQWVRGRRPAAALGWEAAMLLAMRVRAAIRLGQPAPFTVPAPPVAVPAPPVAAQRSQPAGRQRWRV